MIMNLQDKKLRPLKAGTHCYNILSVLLSGITLTDLVASNFNPSCFCLSQRIGDLKKRGHNIQGVKSEGGPYFRYWIYPVDIQKSKKIEEKINEEYMRSGQQETGAQKELQTPEQVENKGWDVLNGETLGQFIERKSKAGEI